MPKGLDCALVATRESSLRLWRKIEKRTNKTIAEFYNRIYLGTTRRDEAVLCSRDYLWIIFELPVSNVLQALCKLPAALDIRRAVAALDDGPEVLLQPFGESIDRIRLDQLGAYRAHGRRRSGTTSPSPSPVMTAATLSASARWGSS